MSCKNLERNLAIRLIIFLVLMAVLPYSMTECIGDFECQYSYYCYKPSGICIQCLDCSQYNRMASDSVNCHRSSNDCGPCKKGFREEFLAQHAKREACVIGETTHTVVMTTTPSTTTVSTSSAIMETLETNTTANSDFSDVYDSLALETTKGIIKATVSAFSVGIILIGVILFYMFKFGRLKQIRSHAGGRSAEPSVQYRRRSSFPLLPLQVDVSDDGSNARQEPPPYDEVGHGHNVPVSEERIVVLQIPEEKQMQMSLDAVPFKDAKYFRSSSSESIESNESLSAESDDYPTIHDEDTSADLWEPGPNYTPRHMQENGDEVPEVDSAQSVPSTQHEHTQSASQANISSDSELLGAAGGSFTCPSTSSSSSQLDLDRPFRQLTGDDGLEQPTRKRLCQEDSLSLGHATQVSAVPLRDHNSSSNKNIRNV